jgi:hypothetical protein
MIVPREVDMPGPSFWFFSVVALITLATAIRFAFRPQERLLAILRALSAATTFASVGASLAGLANGLIGLSRWMEHAPDAASSAMFWPRIVGGLGETPFALVLGFATLTVVWLLVAVGMRRQA